MNGVELERDGNLAVIWLDTPGERVNKLTTGMLDDFSELLDTLKHDTSIEAAVLVSRKKDSFIVGADIEAFKDFATPAEAEAVIREGHALFNRLEGLRKPVVAAIHGAAAGGGLELAMACSYRLVSTHPKTKFSLPEVNLGLLPGLSGTQRLTRLVGVQKALDIMLTGKSVYPKPARKMGLVDATIHPQGLLEAAKQAARELAKGKLETGRDALSWRDRLLERTPLSRVVYQQAEKSVQERTGGHYPAPFKIIDCVRIGQERGFEAGLEAERQGFSELLFTPQSKALIHLFFAKNAAEKNPYKTEAREVETVGVLGAGLMGAGIAQISAAGGFDVLLKDRDLELAAAGKKKVWEGLSKRVGKGMSEFERDQTAERVVPVGDYAPFHEADVVIEAVLEDLDLKRSVLGELEAVNDDFIFATNTSSIPVGQIAAGAAHPERVVGMHYFSPAQKIPLLEIVKTERTPDWVLGTAFVVGLKQGKTVIVVNDAPGFYTTRILAAYMNEALLLLEEGGDIAHIDKAMRAFGFPVGPLTLLDEVGIDVGAKITEVMRDFFEERGVQPSRAGREVVEAGYKGRKNKKGFYKYEGGKSEDKDVNADIYDFFGGPSRKTLPPKLIQDRLAFMMMNEAARCLEEGVIASPTDGDVGAVFGLGFPPFLGGPFWYMDARGLGDVVGTLSELEHTHGARFKPADILKEKAEKGFYSA